MAVTAQSQSQSGLEAIQNALRVSTFLRVIRYTGLRLVTLFITVVIGIYLTIMIANMGGYVDNIMKGEITQSITQKAAASPSMRSMSSDERAKLIQAEITLEENREGLNTPVAVRNFAYLSNALTLNLGTAINMNSDSGSKSVRLIVLERLPATLLLMGTSELSLFFVSLFLALTLSRRYGSFWDKLIIILSPTSTPPAWFYGIFFILLFAAIFKLLPFGGLMDAPPPTNPIDLGLNVIKRLILPAAALFISQFFLSIYNWRTFFLIYSSEDYVEMARPKACLRAILNVSIFCVRPCPPSLPNLPCY